MPHRVVWLGSSTCTNFTLAVLPHSSENTLRRQGPAFLPKNANDVLGSATDTGKHFIRGWGSDPPLSKINYGLPTPLIARAAELFFCLVQLNQREEQP